MCSPSVKSSASQASSRTLHHESEITAKKKEITHLFLGAIYDAALGAGGGEGEREGKEDAELKEERNQISVKWKEGGKLGEGESLLQVPRVGL